MKKLINRPEDVVDEMLDGLVALHPSLRRLKGHKVLLRADIGPVRASRVALVSGGGSGHEPAHAGYVGKGMLSAAVAGAVFTSPDPDSIEAALRAVAGPPGVLLIVKNYTGDRLNFGLAAELAGASGIAVETVIVADDAALAGLTQYAGRRGLAGTVLVHKVAGAAAEEGLALAEVAAEARAAAEAVRTMGVALSGCTIPGADQPGFALGENEVELGLGIHGEPGIERAPLMPADPMVDKLLDRVCADLSLTWAHGDQVALLVNNLGATTTMELAIVARHAIAALEARGIDVARAYAGTYLSALDMAGISISIMRVDAKRLRRLDAPTEAFAWPGAQPRQSGPTESLEPVPAVLWGPAPEAPASSAGEQPAAAQAIKRGFEAAARALENQAAHLNALDQAVGDGDLGTSLLRGLKAARIALDASDAAADPAAALQAIGMGLQRGMGGTSGPLYAVFFLRAAARLRGASLGDPKTWAEAFQAGCDAMAGLGGARPGDRTMLDALVPAAHAFGQALAEGQTTAWALDAAARAADAGASATAQLVPKRGRSSYLGERALGHVDPGAIAVGIWLGALRDAHPQP